MTKTEQTRVLAWRLKVLREASAAPRNVAQACRHFGLSRKSFYKWKARYDAHGDAGLCDQPRAPHHSPRATPREVISKILYLRQRYHFGAGRIADYLQRFHQLKVARSSVHRILLRHGLNLLPANHKRKLAGRASALRRFLRSADRDAIRCHLHFDPIKSPIPKIPSSAKIPPISVRELGRVNHFP
jgi:transposase